MKSEVVGKMTMVSAMVAAIAPFAYAAMGLSALLNSSFYSRLGSLSVTMFGLFAVVFVAATIITIVGCFNLASRNISEHVRSTARVLGILLLAASVTAAFLVGVLYLSVLSGSSSRCSGTNCIIPLTSNSGTVTTYILGPLANLIWPIALLAVEVLNIIIAVRLSHFLNLASQSRRETAGQ
jgi:hypothetical protein